MKKEETLHLLKQGSYSVISIKYMAFLTSNQINPLQVK